VHRHIEPTLGALRINHVSVATVEAFREELRQQLAPRTVNKVLTALSAIFDHAIKHGLTEKNPARVVDRLKLDTGQVLLGDSEENGGRKSTGKVTPEEVPTPEEVVGLIEAAPPGRDRVFFLLAVRTGAREGELLALTWDDFDLDERTVSIRRTVSWAKTRAEREAGLSGPRFYEPKTRAGRRVVELPDEIVPELRRWKLACPPSRMGLVFPTLDGRPLHRRTLHKEALAPALETAKLRHFTVHSLRHFHASVLILRKTAITEVAARLGHASPAVTMAVYAHFLRQVKGESTNAVAEALAAARR
jgi:integrase